MQISSQFIEKYTDFLTKKKLNQSPKKLYEPVNYILSIGGKRMRPQLVLWGCYCFDDNWERALPVAHGVEVFHNFTLVHDDIMDEAPLRRGKSTVHHKFDTNTAILSGDVMLLLSYDYLFEVEKGKYFKKLFPVFNKIAIEVCEGQQYDIDFETLNNVTIPQYIKMITYKTSVLLGCAFQMGAIIANQSKEAQKDIYEYGKLLGIAFQIQDDYLDAFGDPESFGKQVGGDIIENKKTYLYLKAKELGNTSQKEQLHQLFSNKEHNDPQGKIAITKQIFNETGASKVTKETIQNYTEQAFEVAQKLDIPEKSKNMLIDFGTYLMNRRI